jgi:hypothetical protein
MKAPPPAVKGPAAASSSASDSPPTGFLRVEKAAASVMKSESSRRVAAMVGSAIEVADGSVMMPSISWITPLDAMA